MHIMRSSLLILSLLVALCIGAGFFPQPGSDVELPPEFDFGAVEYMPINYLSGDILNE